MIATALSLLDLIAPFLAPIWPILADPQVTEIMINGGGSRIYVERDGRVRRLDGVAIPSGDVLAAIETIASECGRPMTPGVTWEVNARWPDGSRVAALLAPCAVDGPYLTIRRHPAVPFTVADLVAFGTLTADAAAWLTAQVVARRTILFAGPVAAGKTTFVNAFARAIPEADRLAVLEDTAEIRVPHANVLRCEGRPARDDAPAVTLSDLLTAVLRHRPDRIVLGEVRTAAEAHALLPALTTGHRGSFTTLHANDAVGALDRLAWLLAPGGDVSERASREAIAAAIQVVVHLDRAADRRVVTALITVQGYDAATGRWQTTPAPVPSEESAS